MLTLRQAFPDSTIGERRVVARAAGDLSDSGRFAADAGRELGPNEVVEHLADAPDDRSLVERWNWWMGALDVAYGGYVEFAVQAWREE